MSKTSKVVQSVTGLTLKEINSLDYDTEKEFIRKRTHRPVCFSKKIDKRVFGRGNPLISQRRFSTIEDINIDLEELIEKYGKVR